MHSSAGRNILLVGASVRAAAASTMRAGFAPWCIDLFSDADLARACPARRVSLDRYPRGLIEELAFGPAGPWLYGGGLENHPDLLDVPDRELWGNLAGVVRAVRDPACFADALTKFDVPRIKPPFFGRCLVKPLRSSGGLDVRFWAPKRAVPNNCYLQEYAEGLPASAVFVGASGRSRLLGATRQLIGCPWSHAERPFQYAGSIGPLDCRRESLESLGQTLVDAFGLRGVFGVDFLLAGDRIRPVEVNPRYPASLEILERITQQPLLAHHFAAFGSAVNVGCMDAERNAPFARGDLTPSGEFSRREGPVHCTPHPCTVQSESPVVYHGKAILFAANDLVFPAKGPWDQAFDFSIDDLNVPFADLPAPGQQFPRGAPILTFFAKAKSSADCEAALVKMAGDLDRAVGGG
jgi:predicted ATP-grasp superfamily ATP-dependent carboligase